MGLPQPLNEKPDSVSWMEWTRLRWTADFSHAAIADKLWRLNNLYWFIDAEGDRKLFRMRPGMFDVYSEEHWRNILLKARQYGFTTYFAIDQLDDCLFNKNLAAQMTAHNRDDAGKIFRDKIKYAYDELCLVGDEDEPHAGLTREEWAAVGASIKQVAALNRDTAEELFLGNNSSIRVTTSGRSGTVQRLHISELGKIAKQYPEKAREIKSGSLPAAKRGKTWIESTAEGTEGLFHDLCKQAMDIWREGRELNRQEFKFHFHPWWADPDYRMAPEEAATAVIVPRLVEYFAKLLADHDIKLDLAQMAWYAAEEMIQGDDMKREYPATPEEAFEASIEGAIFGKWMTRARIEGRICSVPYTEGIAVDTWWDLGRGEHVGSTDSTAIWFSQRIGLEDMFIDYYESQGEGLPHYVQELYQRRDDFGWIFGQHMAPHDAAHKRLTGSITEIANDLGLFFEVQERTPDKWADIDVARASFSTVRFDKTNCAQGIQRLDNYRKEWDQHRGCWRNKPLHDINSNGADAYLVFAKGRRKSMRAVPKGRGLRKVVATGSRM